MDDFIDYVQLLFGGISALCWIALSLHWVGVW